MTASHNHPLPSPCPVHMDERAAEAVTSVELRREETFRLAAEWPGARPPVAARAACDLNALLKIATALSSIRGLTDLERPLLELVSEAVLFKRGAILLVGRTPSEVDSMFGWDRSGQAGEPIRLSGAVVNKVLREGIAILSRPLEQSDASGHRTVSVTGSTITAPMAVFDRTLGLIHLEREESDGAFDRGHLQMLATIAGVAALALDNHRHVERLEQENRRLHAEINVEHDMVGNGRLMRDIGQFIFKVAATDSTVLIQGESGTGKELVARAIHRSSPRAAEPFVAINCAALTETLLESELFGYEKGAFTGASAQKKGKLEVADRGTLFLDEIAELPLALQPKLLRVLQQREFERVGGTRPVKVDIRLIAATNRQLEEAIATGTFRRDLYYRLNVVSITMPPLRERRDDIPALAMHFVAKYCRKTKRHVAGVSAAASAWLANYDWPGNVRELENVIERAVVLGSTEVILPEDLSEAVLERKRPPGAPVATYHEALTRLKKDLIVKALQQSRGNYTEAAKALALHGNYLHRLIRNLELKSELLKLG